jgi:hypothetical protein
MLCLYSVLPAEKHLLTTFTTGQDKATASDGQETYISTAHSTVSFISLTLLAFMNTEITCVHDPLRPTELDMQLRYFFLVSFDHDHDLHLRGNGTVLGLVSISL